MSLPDMGKIDFDEVHRRRKMLREAYERGEVARPPCWVCQYLVEYAGMQPADVKRGRHWGSNGYTEYLLCDEHYKPEPDDDEADAEALAGDPVAGAEVRE